MASSSVSWRCRWFSSSARHCSREAFSPWKAGHSGSIPNLAAAGRYREAIEWLWQLRLAQARAELALARERFDEAIAMSTESVEQGRARRRPKYETLGLITRSSGFRALGRVPEAIADARRALGIAN
jgi:hypothetical protein